MPTLCASRLPCNTLPFTQGKYGAGTVCVMMIGLGVLVMLTFIRHQRGSGSQRQLTPPRPAGRPMGPERATKMLARTERRGPPSHFTRGFSQSARSREGPKLQAAGRAWWHRKRDRRYIPRWAIHTEIISERGIAVPVARKGVRIIIRCSMDAYRQSAKLPASSRVDRSGAGANPRSPI